MPYKFGNLEVWQAAIEYVDVIYLLAEKLPKSEEYNLKSQIVRAATSVALNIAEGSTGQSDAEHVRFPGMAIRSLIETVACQHLIRRRKYLSETKILDEAYALSNDLARQLQAFRKSLKGNSKRIYDESEIYLTGALGHKTLWFVDRIYFPISSIYTLISGNPFSFS